MVSVRLRGICKSILNNFPLLESAEISLTLVLITVLYYGSIFVRGVKGREGRTLLVYGCFTFLTTVLNIFLIFFKKIVIPNSPSFFFSSFCSLTGKGERRLPTVFGVLNICILSHTARIL